MLNEAPNSNDTTLIANSVYLTTMGAQQFSMAAMLYDAEKNDLLEARHNDTITRKVRVDGNKLCPGKEWRLYAQ